MEDSSLLNVVACSSACSNLFLTRLLTNPPGRSPGNSEEPNLKNDLELLLRGYVNGKYLYNKHREASSGKPIIKISREYKLLFFNYLGFRNVAEFIKSDLFTAKQNNGSVLYRNMFIFNAIKKCVSFL